ncbi:hypothetical protein G9A89_016450 [Geosiphon pyriformis]|nr:hypothetical protein G9A89_016450 [Geosiphon pyriformis]
MPIDNAWKQALRHLEEYPHDENKIWRMAYAMSKGATTEELREIKNNPLSLPEPKYVQTFNAFALMKKKQEQCLEEINTRLCNYCLISCDFQYCDECNPIYNLPPRIIYIISEEEEPISSCTSKSESPINCTSNSDDDNNNNNSNSDSDPEQYITLSDLTKNQELKWFSDNNKGIMPEQVHDTNARFDLRYPEKKAIKLEPHSHICIDLKVALEILATTIIQLASRSSLVKRGINIRGGIIDMGYVGNIITMLQNNSEKAYIIELNKKIAQAIFLPLVRVAQLVLVGKRKELGITARGIQRFGSTGRIDVPVNMAEEKMVGQGEIISTSQAISILSYNQYMITIKREVKDQAQIFEAEASLCELGKVGLINLHIPAKNYNHIKIPIYNNTRNVVNISEGIIIGYLTTEIEDQPLSTIPDFPQLCEYVDIISQTIYG